MAILLMIFYFLLLNAGLWIGAEFIPGLLNHLLVSPFLSNAALTRSFVFSFVSIVLVLFAFIAIFRLFFNSRYETGGLLLVLILCIVLTIFGFSPEIERKIFGANKVFGFIANFKHWLFSKLHI